MKKRLLSVILAAILSMAAMGCSEVRAPKIDRYEKEVLQKIHTVSVSFNRMKAKSDGIAVITDETPRNDGYINAEYAGVFSKTRSEALYVKNPLDRLYPASLTKCMTALLVLESDLSFTDQVTVTEAAFEGLTADASMAGLKAGWTYSVEDLMYGLLLPSGNEAANMLGIAVSGSVDAFVALMNRRALELGMVDTHFMNPNGLHHVNHYTTVYDLYLLFNAVTSIPEFESIAGSKGKTITARKGAETEQRTYTNTNSFFRGFTVPPSGISILAGKTGYTVQAGRCLILLSSNMKGERFITVIAHAHMYDEQYSEMNALLEIAAGA